MYASRINSGSIYTHSPYKIQSNFEELLKASSPKGSQTVIDKLKENALAFFGGEKEVEDESIIAPKPVFSKQASTDQIFEDNLDDPCVIGEASEELQNIFLQGFGPDEQPHFELPERVIHSPGLAQTEWRAFNGFFSPELRVRSSVPTPPLRAHNPMTLNSPFSGEETGKPEGAELGIFCPSPPPRNQQSSRSNYRYRRERERERDSSRLFRRSWESSPRSNLICGAA